MCVCDTVGGGTLQEREEDLRTAATSLNGALRGKQGRQLTQTLQNDQDSLDQASAAEEASRLFAVQKEDSAATLQGAARARNFRKKELPGLQYQQAVRVQRMQRKARSTLGSAMQGAESRRSVRALLGDVSGMRKDSLLSTFDLFDLDASGEIDQAEFLEIGEALHPTGPAWTESKSAEAFAVLDRDGDGKIDRLEFVIFYAEAFEKASDAQFEAGVARFERVARTVRQNRAAAAIQGGLQGATSRRGVADAQNQDAATIAAGLAAKRSREYVSGLQAEESVHAQASAATVAAGLSGKQSRRFVSEMQEEEAAHQIESASVVAAGLSGMQSRKETALKAQRIAQMEASPDAPPPPPPRFVVFTLLPLSLIQVAVATVSAGLHGMQSRQGVASMSELEQERMLESAKLLSSGLQGKQTRQAPTPPALFACMHAGMYVYTEP